MNLPRDPHEAALAHLEALGALLDTMELHGPGGYIGTVEGLVENNIEAIKKCVNIHRADALRRSYCASRATFVVHRSGECEVYS